MDRAGLEPAILFLKLNLQSSALTNWAIYPMSGHIF